MSLLQSLSRLTGHTQARRQKTRQTQADQPREPHLEELSAHQTMLVNVIDSHGTSPSALLFNTRSTIAGNLLLGKLELFRPWNRDALEATLVTVTDLVQQIHCRALAALKSPDVVDVVLSQRHLSAIGLR